MSTVRQFLTSPAANIPPGSKVSNVSKQTATCSRDLDIRLAVTVEPCRCFDIYYFVAVWVLFYQGRHGLHLTRSSLKEKTGVDHVVTGHVKSQTCFRFFAKDVFTQHIHSQPYIYYVTNLTPMHCCLDSLPGFQVKAQSLPVPQRLTL